MMNTDSRFLKVIDKPGLRRDVQSGAIINTQASDHDKYIQQRKVLMQQHKRIDQLESDMQDIKQLLKQVLEKL